MTPGINKDSNNCFWSPHNNLHSKAAELAIKATNQYMEDIIAQLNEKETRLLFGVGPTMAFAIDTTGSMADIIASVSEMSIAIVNARLGTPDEPSLFVVAPFNDPTTGPDTVTSDFDTFQSAISSLFASGGGDCPELSLTGMLDAMSLMSGPADLFMMTDAAPKDFDLAADVITAAFEKNINIHIFKFDSSCDDGLAKRQDSTSNQVYASVATASGGSYYSLPRDEVGSISDLVDTLTKSDSASILKIDDTASSGTANSYNVPVDSQMSEISISVRGSGVTSLLTKPDGSTLDLTSAGVSSTVLSDGQFITVKSPAAGTWTVSIVGDASFSLDATGVSSLQLSSFNFVALSGRPGHEGYFPISSQPAYDHDVAAVATLDGAFSRASFDLRSPAGAVVVDAGMEPGSGEEGEAPANSFYGEMRLSPGTLYAYCSGVDAAGAPFQRVLASVFTPFLSNSTITGFNDTDPFAVLSSLTNSSTSTTANATSASTFPTPYPNSTTNSISLTSATNSSLASTSSASTTTSMSSSVFLSHPSSWPNTTTLPNGPYWTPAPDLTTNWRNPHSCEPGVVYTHSKYGWDDSETATTVTYTTVTHYSGAVSTITLTATSLIQCPTCRGPNYPEYTDEGQWSSADASHLSNTFEPEQTATKEAGYDGWSSQTPGSEPTAVAGSWSGRLTSSFGSSAEPLDTPYSSRSVNGPASEVISTATATRSGGQAPYASSHTSALDNASVSWAGGATGTASPSIAQFTGGAERVFGIEAAVWALGMGVGVGAGGLVMG